MAPDPPPHSMDNYDAAPDLPMPVSDESDDSVDSDNEAGEQPAFAGYVYAPLGQHEHLGANLDNDADSEIEADQVNDEDINNSNQQIEDPSAALPTTGRAEVAALWNSVPAQGNSIEMNDQRCAEIRAAMVGFTLPPSKIPNWVSKIPEELWKEKILEWKQFPSCPKPTNPPMAKQAE